MARSQRAYVRGFAAPTLCPLPSMTRCRHSVHTTRSPVLSKCRPTQVPVPHPLQVARGTSAIIQELRCGPQCHQSTNLDLILAPTGPQQDLLTLGKATTGAQGKSLRIQALVPTACRPQLRAAQGVPGADGALGVAAHDGDAIPSGQQ
jgi:hypothetical protein